MGRRERLEDWGQGVRDRRMVRRTRIRYNFQMLRGELRDSERASGPVPRALSRLPRIVLDPAHRRPFAQRSRSEAIYATELRDDSCGAAQEDSRGIKGS